MAYCGMAAALSVAPDAAGGCVSHCDVHRSGGGQLPHRHGLRGVREDHGLTAYGAVSLLSLLFVPDKEVALTFVFLLGYYPLAKPYFERIRPALLRAVCKLLLCNGGILAMYGLVLLLVPAGSIAEELRTTALAVSLVTLAMGNVAFLLYDRGAPQYADAL